MKYFRSILLVLMLGCLLQTHAQDSAAETAIRNTLADQSEAWNKGDIEGFMKGYWENDSLMFIGKKGITYGWSNTLANYRQSYPDKTAMGQLHFDIISVKRLSDQYQQVTGRWHLHRSAGDLEGYFTLLLRKIRGQWLIISDHSS